MNDENVEEFYSFLRFASISTDEQYAADVNGCAERVVRKFRNAGLAAEVIATIEREYDRAC